MTPTPRARRPAGKRGKRPGVTPAPLRLGHFRSTAPQAPPAGDVTAGITDWQMLGNDKWSCCGPAATAHYRMAKAGTVNLPNINTDSVLSLYFAYGTAMGEPGPNPDQGVDNATWLKWLFDQRVIEGYAWIDPTNADTVHRAMIDYSGVLIAVDLTPDAEEDFSMHLPWTVTATDQPDPNAGHDILLVSYDGTGDTFVTWGGLQKASVDWDNAAIAEAWVIITSDDAQRLGVDLGVLRDQIESFGGTVDPAFAPPTPSIPATPPPAPPPQATPPPVAASSVLDDAVAIAQETGQTVSHETKGFFGRVRKFFSDLF